MRSYAKRILIMLAIAMVIIAMPLAAFAEEADTGEANVPASEQVEVPDGWQEGKTVYYENGSMVKKAVKTIDGKLYYFNGSGKVTTYKNKWVKAGGKKYWFNAKRKIVTAPTYIKNSKGKKVLYMFAKDGKLIVKKKGIFSYNGKEYYSLGKGKLKTGWVAAKNKAMYFNKKTCKTGSLGSMAKNTTVGYLKVPKNGRLGKAYALGVKQLDKSGWKLWNAYQFSYRLTYKDRWYRRKTSEDYAIRGFTKGYGNCYVMAATFYIQAKLLGYDVHQVHGKIGIWPHSWTVINHDGREWVYDPNFRNETGRNGWKIYYGKSGTWRYSKYSKMN